MIKRLKTYIPFSVNRIKQQLAYKGAFYLFIFVKAIGPFIHFYLWMAVYGSADSGVLGGLSRNEMVTYVFMAYVTGCTVNISIAKTVSEDIIKGTVSMNLIKPIDYRMSLIARAAGDMAYRFLIPGVIVWIGLEIYRVWVFGERVADAVTIFFYLLSVLMSFLIYVLFDFCFGMIAFFTTYIFGLTIAKNAVLSFLTGQLIPLSFFPVGTQRLFDLLPFSSMIYTPVMIYLEKYSESELVYVLLRQAAWVIALYIFGTLIWRKAVEKLVVLGG